jgi:hypothetical protein
LYQELGINYPKFFKMDILSKVAFLSAEALQPYPENINKENVAVIISTTSGCWEADMQFEKSRETIPSPAVFVYTLPNIMLGEICIRHGFKGEQTCMVHHNANAATLAFMVQDVLHNRGMDACLFGYVDATENNINAVLFWVTKNKETAWAIPFSEPIIKQLLDKI